MKDFLAKYKKTVIIFSIILVFVLITVLSYIFFILNKGKNTSTQNNEQTMSEIYTGPPPAPVFSNWVEGEEGQVNTAEVNDQSSVYSFKTSYTPQEISKISSIVHVTEEPEVNGYSVFTNYATDSASLLLFKKTDGSLSYTSTSGMKLSSTVDIPTQIVEKITELGIYDSSIKVTASYRRKSKPGIQYYELHRDWKEIGYPIFNPVGLLNLPENELLHNLSFTTRDEHYKDTDIYDASDQNNAYARKTDFNTMTIMVDEQKNVIIYIESNIQPITKENKVFSKSELLTKEEALEKLRNGEQSIFLTTPSGEGAPDFLKVYPNNTAVGNEAVIEESIVVYLENLTANQTVLEPYYIFRGYSELTSGYRVRFIAAVLAIKNNNIAGVSTIAQGQHQDTLTFPTASPVTPTIPQTLSPTILIQSPTLGATVSTNPSPVISVTPPDCGRDVNANDALATYEFNGYKFGVFFDPIFQQDIKLEAFWYIIPSGELSQSSTEVKIIVDQFLKHIKENKIEFNLNADINTEGRGTDYFFTFLGIANPNCPFRITGSSPTIFAYGSVNSTFDISIANKIIYSEPSINGEVVIKENNQVLINHALRNYLYYEYEPLSFAKPELGWVIKRSNLLSFSKSMASKLRLNSIEESRLVFELQHASFNINSPYIFIGLIPQSEINEKLPLKVTPHIENMQRYHFYVEGLQHEVSTVQPKIKPVLRTETMLLEFGAIKGKE